MLSTEDLDAMLLKDRFASQGALLFRWRSYLPLVLLVPTLIALPQSGLLEDWFGEITEDIWTGFSTFLAFAGLGIRIATVGFVSAGTSGRNTTAQRAERLNTTGLYSVVRNPLYLGNAITLLGFVFAAKVWWLALIAVPAVLLYYERIVYAEEGFLLATFGSAYKEWTDRTPPFWPNFRLWRRPDLPFSLRSALRREYHGFYLIVVVLTVIEIATDLIGEGESFGQWAQEDLGWPIFFLVGTVIYLAIRTIRKKTDWLVVAGR